LSRASLIPIAFGVVMDVAGLALLPTHSELPMKLLS
jgi:hypothetical protein